MLLAVDVGNTNIVVGVFEGGELLASWRIATDRNRMPDEYAMLLRSFLEHRGLHLDDIHGLCLSSVVPPLTTTFRELALAYLGREPVVVSAELETGVKLRVDHPQEVGADRIVNALAVIRRHRLPAIVIDFGTATTFDPISADGELLGTAIAPGFRTAMEGLFQRAARLASVELVAPPSAIGRNTVHAIQSGAVYGYVGLVEGLVKRIRRELDGDPLIVATGGLASAVLGQTDVIDVHDPDLTLHGLRYFYELNAPRPQLLRRDLA